MTEIFSTILAVFCMLIFSSQAQSKNHDLDDIIMLAAAETPVTAEISEESFKGQASFSLAITPEKKSRFSAIFDHFNIVLFDVDQALLAKGYENEESSSPVGFRVLGNQRLAFDPERSIITGTLKGIVDYDHQQKLVSTEIGSNAHHHIENPPAQLAALDVEITIPKEYVERFLSDDNTEEKYDISVQVLMKLQAPETEFYKGFFVKFEPNKTIISWGRPFHYTIGKSLCIQPINIAALDASKIPQGFEILVKPFLQPSGRGFYFGMPYARETWGKVGVAFEVREWITLNKEEYLVTTPWETNGTGVQDTSGNSDLNANLYAEVNISDCIEVYFVHTFSVEDWWGGGGSSGTGHSGVKIITSDTNDNGIDFHHLAHELGHVLGLLHPGETPILNYPQTAASKGTVMCPSGFRFDNPSKNSFENGQFVQNPLLRLTLVRKQQGPDCQNSRDCGQCPDLPE
ncbi:MAG: hypothetical protein AAF756_14235 [Pseudomonadota bacterium]